jgi:hypothetical protein
MKKKNITHAARYIYALIANIILDNKELNQPWLWLRGYVARPYEESKAFVQPARIGSNRDRRRCKPVIME